ncbi:MAG: hypothetical protein KIT68_11865 [Phycisphaeraceae bacterium]|nr:hypothetical protein [Phycisphaeraceae bacterium]
MGLRVVRFFGRPAVRQHLAIEAFPFVAGFIIPAVWGVHLAMGRQMPVGLAYALLVLVIAGLVFSLARGLILRRRLARACVAAGHLLCTRCFHPLAGLDSPGRCPECGEPYRHAELRETWLWIFGPG